MMDTAFVSKQFLHLFDKLGKSNGFRIVAYVDCQLRGNVAEHNISF